MAIQKLQQETLFSWGNDDAISCSFAVACTNSQFGYNEKTIDHEWWLDMTWILFSHVKNVLIRKIVFLPLEKKIYIFVLLRNIIIFPHLKPVCGSKMLIWCVLMPMDQFHLHSLITFELLTLNGLLSKIC